jgi:hypothetical protein
MKLSILFSLFAYVLTSSMANINNIRISQSKRSLFADVPSFPLFNAAETGLHFPALGLGTGFYGMQNEPSQAVTIGRKTRINVSRFRYNAVLTKMFVKTAL